MNSNNTLTYKRKYMKSESDFGYTAELEYVNNFKSKLAYHLYDDDGDFWVYCSLYKYKNIIYIIDLIGFNLHSFMKQNIYTISNIDTGYCYTEFMDVLNEYFPDYEIRKYNPDEFAVFQICNKIFHNVYEKNKFEDIFINHELSDDIINVIANLTFDAFTIEDYIISNDYGDLDVVIRLCDTKKINQIWFINSQN